MALTELEVKKAKPEDKHRKLFDGGGMYLMVHTNGSKYWRMDYRIGGKQKTLSIGVYPNIRETQIYSLSLSTKLHSKALMLGRD